jgi:hypothetical protein
MRITKNQLKQIIKEELGRVLAEEISTLPDPKGDRKLVDYATVSQDEMDGITADFTDKRKMYAQDPSTRPQGFEKSLADAGHYSGKFQGKIESFFRTLSNIPNALRDAQDVIAMSQLGGYHGVRTEDAMELANKRIESGDWTEDQATDFVNTIQTTLKVGGVDLEPSKDIKDFTIPPLPEETPMKENRRRKVRKR